jgi:hypothetical protein
MKMSKITYAKYDITNLIYGEFWDLFLSWKNKDGTPISLTGKRLYGEFRAGKDRTAQLITIIDSDDDTIEITNAEDGEFKIVLSSEKMLLFEKGKGVWDLWVLDGAKKNLLIFGNWQSSEAATNWATFTP